MGNSNVKKDVKNEKDNLKTIELPKDVQKQMMEFFLQTSIPRKKANNKITLSENEKDR